MAHEKYYENKIKKYLKSKNIFYVKYFGCAFTRAGVPDLLCCVNGRFVAIEVKSTIGSTSLLQEETIKEIQSAGGIAIITHPENFNELKKIIENLLNNA